MERLVENKKGNEGWVVGFWNTFESGEWRGTKDGSCTLYIMKVEVVSCGKKQMTLLEKKSGEMTREFHKPDRLIYRTEQYAREACWDLFETWKKNSMESAEKFLTRAETHHDWWPAQVKKIKKFMKDLDFDRIPFIVHVR